jgi:hypothetical protein
VTQTSVLVCGVLCVCIATDGSQKDHWVCIQVPWHTAQVHSCGSSIHKTHQQAPKQRLAPLYIVCRSWAELHHRSSDSSDHPREQVQLQQHRVGGQASHLLVAAPAELALGQRVDLNGVVRHLCAAQHATGCC